MPKKYYAIKRSRRRVAHRKFYIIAGVLTVLLAVGIFFIVLAVTGQPGTSSKPVDMVILSAPPISSSDDIGDDADSSSLSDADSNSAASSSAMAIAQGIVPKPTDEKAKGRVNTDPSAFGLKTDIKNGDKTVDSYTRDPGIFFGTGSEYTSLEGVITFRGNNYKDSASFGIAEIKDGKLKKFLAKETGSLGDKRGAAWTGQPIVVKWPDNTRKNMKTLYDEFKNKDGFMEVILTSYDGHVYFMDAETGKKTRNPISLGVPTKGTPSLYPSGIPMLFVGQGLQADGSLKKSGNMYYRAVNLLTGKVTKIWGYANKDPFAYRDWQAYDSSALIDAKTDTLIEPGENGIIYTVKLNTNYDEEAGKLSIKPDPPVKYRYTADVNKTRDKSQNGRWGIEDSVAAWRNYIFFTDNAGILQCVDINTMKPVYANDMGNNSAVSMVLEEDTASQKIYLYTGSEYDDEAANATKPGNGDCYARKIDGLSGQILWEQKFTCDSSDDKADGGIIASPVLGKDGTNMEGLIVYSVSNEVTGGSTTSELVAMNKLSGEIKWRYDMKVTGWSPSSPVPVYTEDGKGYIVQCDGDGDVALIDGATGEEVDNLHLKVTNSSGKVKDQNNFEATPVVYNNTIVVASRTGNIFFIKIS